MANYNGRRMPNFSQYLDDLNAIPSPYDQAQQQQQQQQTTFNDEDLALFTNTEFFEFDKFTDFGGLPPFSPEDEKHEVVSDQSAHNADLKFLDFLNAEGLNGMSDYQPDLTRSNVQVPMHNAHYSALPSVPSGPVAVSQAPIQPAPINTVPKVAPAPSVSMSPSTPATGTKRKNSANSTQENAEEASRHMAEEDKRRRNTAASARFRVKKKQREAALEQTVKETTDKNDILEARVSQLELENHWLRGLIMEKNGADEQSEQDISDMFKKFLASQKADGSSISDLKRGVGTTV